ncbi:MAG TPA: ribonuclease H [Acidimicrobiia bacterium]|nr:ribonuclease H [Acidimicrobiia bacterium]
MATFTCRDCGAAFSLPERVLARYPGWNPSQCLDCRDGARTAPGVSRSTAPLAFEDPGSGVFTDGGASPNPGPGGWGAVYVIDGEIVSERHGHDPATTNNRMELTALIEGAALVPEGTPVTVYSDSNLAVRTINEWAAGWEKRGWKRKTGPVENLDLVQKAYRIYRRRPELTLEWVKGHAGVRWNEYADALANRWRTG